MTAFVFDIDQFRIDYPAFSNPVSFPDATLQRYFDMAGCYIENNTSYNLWLNGDCRYTALTLMTAHLTAISVLIANGQIVGLVQNATIDKVTVGLTPPPFKNQYQWWINSTPYGQELEALLQAKSVGGMFIGGLPETSGFRRVGGVFV